MPFDIDAVALARQAGLCFADCHFLDCDPAEGLEAVLAEMETPEQQVAYRESVQRELDMRRRHLHHLESFVALILSTAADLIQDTERGSWLLRESALQLEARNRPLDPNPIPFEPC